MVVTIMDLQAYLPAVEVCVQGNRLVASKFPTNQTIFNVTKGLYQKLSEAVQDFSCVHRVCRHKSSELPNSRLKGSFECCQVSKVDNDTVKVFKDFKVQEGVLLSVLSAFSEEEKCCLVTTEALRELHCCVESSASDIYDALKKSRVSWKVLPGLRPVILYKGAVLVTNADTLFDLLSSERFTFDSYIDSYVSKKVTETTLSLDELTGLGSLLRSDDPDTVKLGCKLFLTADLDAVPETAKFIIRHNLAAFRYVRYNKAFMSLVVRLNIPDSDFTYYQNIPLEKCLKGIPEKLEGQDRNLLQGIVREELQSVCSSLFDSIVLK